MDPVAAKLDVVIRMAELRDSDLISRYLGSSRVVMAAAPQYLDRQGRPRTPEDLRRHSCLSYLGSGLPMDWTLRTPEGQEVTLPVSGRLHVNSCEALRKAAVAGVGITYLLGFNVAADLRSGALEQVLADYEIEPRPFYAIYPRNRHLTPKVRVFLDFLVELFSASDGVATRRAQRERRSA